jgi:hypothetical protein
MKPQVSYQETSEISARLECQSEFKSPAEIKRVAELLQNTKIRADGGPWRIIKRLAFVSAPVPWLLF